MPTRAERRGLLRRATLTRGAFPFTLAQYYVSELPVASLWTGAHVFVLDDVGGPVEAFSDGTNWRRVTDLAIVSAVLSTGLYGVGTATGIFDGVAGPYLVGPGTATGTFATASIVAGALSATGTATGILGTPPKVTGDLSASGSAAGTLATASRVAADLDADGSATGILVGEAA